MNKLEIYIRGLGWIFSGGLDDLAMERGGKLIDWYQAEDVAAEICQMKVKPRVYIAGHSLGGGAAFQMANELAKCNVRVIAIVAMDPVGRVPVSADIRVATFWNPVLHSVMTHDPNIKNTIREMFRR